MNNSTHFRWGRFCRGRGAGTGKVEYGKGSQNHRGGGGEHERGMKGKREGEMGLGEIRSIDTELSLSLLALSSRAYSDTQPVTRMT